MEQQVPSRALRFRRTLVVPAAAVEATAAAAATRTRRAKPASGAFARSHLAAKPSEAARSGFADTFRLGAHLPPADRSERTLTRLSATRDFHPFVELRDHHPFDDGQQFGRCKGRDTEDLAERQRRGKAPAHDGASQHMDLTARSTDQGPAAADPHDFRRLRIQENEYFSDAR